MVFVILSERITHILEGRGFHSFDDHRSNRSLAIVLGRKSSVTYD
jgi:ribonucleotide monophosphatase NagD (HAD superfamily)